jgi:hypothetical protein
MVTSTVPVAGAEVAAETEVAVGWEMGGRVPAGVEAGVVPHAASKNIAIKIRDSLVFIIFSFTWRKLSVSVKEIVNQTY